MILLINDIEYAVISTEENPEYELKVFKCLHDGKNYNVYTSMGANDKERKTNFRNLRKIIKMLDHSKILTPKFIFCDKKQFMIVQESVSGQTCLEMLSERDLTDEIYDSFFYYSSFARAMGFNLSYSPKDYTLHEDKLYYTGTMILPYSKETSLVETSVMLWVYSKPLTKLLTENGLKVDTPRLKGNAETNKEVVCLVYKHYQL